MNNIFLKGSISSRNALVSTLNIIDFKGYVQEREQREEAQRNEISARIDTMNADLLRKALDPSVGRGVYYKMSNLAAKEEDFFSFCQPCTPPPTPKADVVIDEATSTRLGYEILSRAIANDWAQEFGDYSGVLAELKAAVQSNPAIVSDASFEPSQRDIDDLIYFLRLVEAFYVGGLSIPEYIDFPENIPSGLIVRMMAAWPKIYKGLDFSNFRSRTIEVDARYMKTQWKAKMRAESFKDTTIPTWLFEEFPPVSSPVRTKSGHSPQLEPAPPVDLRTNNNFAHSHLSLFYQIKSVITDMSSRSVDSQPPEPAPNRLTAFPPSELASRGEVQIFVNVNSATNTLSVRLDDLVSTVLAHYGHPDSFLICGCKLLDPRKQLCFYGIEAQSNLTLIDRGRGGSSASAAICFEEVSDDELESFNEKPYFETHIRQQLAETATLTSAILEPCKCGAVSCLVSHCPNAENGDYGLMLDVMRFCRNEVHQGNIIYGILHSLTLPL